MVTEDDLKILGFKDIDLFYDSIIDKAFIEDYGICDNNISLLSINQKDNFLIYLSKLDNSHAIRYCFKKALQ